MWQQQKISQKSHFGGVLICKNAMKKFYIIITIIKNAESLLLGLGCGLGYSMYN